MSENLNSFARDEYVIIRTESAGVWCGKLLEKAGREVILGDARRMWSWKCKKSISLSGVAAHGIDPAESKICPRVAKVWMEAIEIIPVSGEALASILDTPDVEAEEE